MLTFVPWEGRGRGEDGKTLSRKSKGKGNERRSKSKGEVGESKKSEEKRRKRRRQRKRGKKGGEQLKNKQWWWWWWWWWWWRELLEHGDGDQNGQTYNNGSGDAPGSNFGVWCNIVDAIVSISQTTIPNTRFESAEDSAFAKRINEIHPGAVLTSEHALMWTPEAWSLCSRSCGGGGASFFFSIDRLQHWPSFSAAQISAVQISD